VQLSALGSRYLEETARYGGDVSASPTSCPIISVTSDSSTRSCRTRPSSTHVAIRWIAASALQAALRGRADLQLRPRPSGSLLTAAICRSWITGMPCCGQSAASSVRGAGARPGGEHPPPPRALPAALRGRLPLLFTRRNARCAPPAPNRCVSRSIPREWVTGGISPPSSSPCVVPRRQSRALPRLKRLGAASLQRTALVERSLTKSARTKDDRDTRQRKKRAIAVTDGEQRMGTRTKVRAADHFCKTTLPQAPGSASPSPQRASVAAPRTPRIGGDRGCCRRRAAGSRPSRRASARRTPGRPISIDVFTHKTCRTSPLRNSMTSGEGCVDSFISTWAPGTQVFFMRGVSDGSIRTTRTAPRPDFFLDDLVLSWYGVQPTCTFTTSSASKSERPAGYDLRRRLHGWRGALHHQQARRESLQRRCRFDGGKIRVASKTRVTGVSQMCR